MTEATQLPLLTSSRLKDARACQRLHKHRYIDGYVPLDDAAPLRFGGMIHRALEAWWLNQDDAPLSAALEQINSPDYLYEEAMARALMFGYDARWSRQAYKVLSVEGQFRVPLINPETGAPSRTWQLGGKWDAIAQEPNGRVLLVEHKTASDDITPGSDYWKRLRMDGQVSTYFAGALASGYEVEACLYDVLGKPGLRPLKATPTETRKYKADGSLYANQRDADETPDEYEARLTSAIVENPERYYQRGEIVRLASEMDEAAFDTWTIAQQLRAAQVAGRWPRNPDACVRYGRTCSYFSVCSGEASLDDPMLFKKLETVHPELSQTA